jgi:glycosyltransferase involved in cell wall biosynthesis
VKILHLIDSGGLYGAERVLLHLAAEQQKAGLRPVIASIGAIGEASKPLELAAVQHGLPVARFRMCPGPNFAGARRILDFARQEGIDLLHSHGYKGDILFGLLPPAKRQLPLLTTLHGWTATRRLSRIALYEWLDRRVLPRLDAVVVVCRSMREHPWFAGRRLPLQVVCNGIPEAAPEEEGRLEPAIVDFCRGGYCVGAFGRLSAEKGFDRLIAAFAAVVAEDPNARLLILGEGSERPALEAQARRLGLDRSVCLPGFREGAAGYLKHFDLFVLSSLTEGLPLAVLEAMQAGVPVLATRVGAVPELLAEGDAGYLLDTVSADAIAAAIGTLRRQPQAVRQRVERAGRRVRELYSSRRMAAGYTDIYRQLLAGAGSP